MEPTGTVSIRLTPDKITALNAIAEQQQHSRNQIMNQAIDCSLEMHHASEKYGNYRSKRSEVLEK